ncbi:MAG: DUF362 domain-containing protein [Chloroflexi bacterium]|nr:DUF362 domain-containing protein [Chloroflexota bacterium]MCL5026950.1 DUF362 domain-containing protein [Chloroflexota bacterium]
MAQPVFFMDDRAASIETSLVNKMLTVFKESGIQDLIKPHDIVAIKIHCGEYNNTGYLRPVFPRALADRVKELGGRPFVCDTTTAFYSYYAGRANALDELLTAERNGFTSASLGCPFIVADGFLGDDDVRVDLPEGTILKEQYVAKAIAMADKLLVLTHFKGHGAGVFGGSIKNIGVGAASKRGKFNLHFGGHSMGFRYAPFFEHLARESKSRAWLEELRDSCPWGLFTINEHTFEWDQSRCVCGPGGGGPCNDVLGRMRGIHEDAGDANPVSISDSALACLKIVGAGHGTGNAGFINLAIDITPVCDCAPMSDRPIIPNMGVFASKDIVAVDAACVDMATASVGIPGSRAYEDGVMGEGVPKFAAAASRFASSQDFQLNNGTKIGLGNRDYELITAKPGPRSEAVFHWDPRPVAVRMREMIKKDPVYPEGGYKRVETVDLESLR